MASGITTVTFVGKPLVNLGALACPSTPSMSSVTVTSGTVVNFVNRTGRTATLRVGTGTKSLPDRTTVPVTFGGGPAVIVVQMLPVCALDLGAHLIMTVTVIASTPKPAQPPPRATSTTTSRTTTRPSATPPTSVRPGTSAPASGAGPNTRLDPSSNETMEWEFGAVSQDDPGRASGMLVLIAAAGVLGVSVAAIRVLASRRAAAGVRR